MVVYNRHGISESTSLQSPGTPQSFWKKRCCHAGNSDGFTVISSCFFVFTIAVTGSLIIQIYFGTGEVTPHGAVASDDQTCSEIGIHTIRDGGSAADAAIATLLCLSVTQPHVAGPGGGGVVLIHDHKLNESKILDFMVLHKTGNSTTGVPGFLKGLERLHKLYGKLPFKDLIHPAIKLAREGFLASKQLVDALRKVNFDLLNLNFQSEFFPKGIMIKENQILLRKNYAKFLEAVSIVGADEIHLLKYRSEMMKAFDTLGSNVTIDDLLDYEIIERKLVRERLFNVTISTVGPPFGGLQVIAGLELMKEHDITSETQLTKLYEAFTQGLLLGIVLTKTKFQPDSDFLNETSTLMTKLTSHGFSLSDLPHPTVPESVASQVSVIDTFDLYVSVIVNIPSIDGMPKPAVGILTHHEDLALNNLWLDIMKLSIEAGKYCYILKEIQGTEEKLLKLLGDSNIAVHSPELRIIIDEYLSVVVEIKKYSDEASNTAHEVLGSTPEQYRLLYEDVNTFRKKRDLLVSEIEKCQDRLDRLKLKGKRTTDVLVEKERNVRQLRDLHSKLLTEAEKFHNLRIKCLQCAVEASVHNQINYYGSITQEFSKYINQNKEGQHPMRERQYLDTVGSHLDKIRMLTIVDES